MMRWPRKGRWMCVSARCWLESLNLTHQTTGTVLATETVVIASLSADRGRNEGKPSRTRNRSVPTSKRPRGQPAIFLPACASTANDRHDEVAGELPTRASREAGSRGCCGLAAPALSAMKPTVGRSAATRRSQSLAWAGLPVMDPWLAARGGRRWRCAGGAGLPRGGGPLRESGSRQPVCEVAQHGVRHVDGEGRRDRRCGHKCSLSPRGALCGPDDQAADGQERIHAAPGTACLTGTPPLGRLLLHVLDMLGGYLRHQVRIHCYLHEYPGHGCCPVLLRLAVSHPRPHRADALPLPARLS